MYVEIYKTPPRRRVGNPRRDRVCHDHLQIRAVLPGRERRFLASIALMVQREHVIPTLERCRRRLAEVCKDQDEVNRLLARIEERLSREVEATQQAQEAHRKQL